MLIRPVREGDRAVLKMIADEILKPLYGDQAKAFNEWMTGSGFKHAFVAVEDDIVVGFLSLKANPDRQYLKISTLLVLPKFKGKGFGRALLEKAECFAREHSLNSLIVTVSEIKTESISFFEKHGFIVIAERIGKYLEGVKEFILRKELS